MAAAAVTVRAAPDKFRQRKWTIVRVASPIVLLALWQLGSALGVIPQDVLPAPSLIADAGIELVRNGQLADALGVSGRRVVQGMLLGGL
ncbi:MAG: ABC transporter permease, partial [Mycobacterium sp.]